MRKIMMEVSVKGGILEPRDLPHLLDEVEQAVGQDFRSIIVIGGRLPVWAYGALVHLFHPAVAVCTFEPRLGMGVCVATHTPELRVGDLVPIEDAEIKKVEYEPIHLK